MGGITTRERLAGAIWGQLVGDAAALGTHWIYDPAAIAKAHPELRGFEAPAPGHYHYGRSPGEQTHYGDGALVALRSIVEVGGFDRDHFGRAFVEQFGAGYGGYLDHATKETLANVAAGKGFAESGAVDAQMATITRLAPLVARHAAEPGLLARVEALTRVAQNDDAAVHVNQAAAAILASLLTGATAETALAEVLARADIHEDARDSIARARSTVSEATTPAVKRLGQSCGLLGSFPSALHAFLKHARSFEDAILETIRAGGDNAGRAAVVGAWLGALLGVEAIPQRWRGALAAATEVTALVEALIEVAVAGGTG